MDGVKVLVIVPAYNEAESIESVVQDIARHADYDIAVVNDGSSDDTVDICRRISDQIRILDLPNNLGIGGAVQAGYKFAYANGYDVAVQFDGDGQHDGSYLKPLVCELLRTDKDLIIGSRFIEGKKSEFQSTAMRRLGISIIRSLIKLVSGKLVTDPTSGFRACSKRAISFFCREYPMDYPEPESIVAIQACGMSVGELPVEMRSRQGGSSSIKALSSIYYMMKVSLAILIQGSKCHRRVQ